MDPPSLCADPPIAEKCCIAAIFRLLFFVLVYLKQQEVSQQIHDEPLCYESYIVHSSRLGHTVLATLCSHSHHTSCPRSVHSALDAVNCILALVAENNDMVRGTLQWPGSTSCQLRVDAQHDLAL